MAVWRSSSASDRSRLAHPFGAVQVGGVSTLSEFSVSINLRHEDVVVVIFVVVVVEVRLKNIGHGLLWLLQPIDNYLFAPFSKTGELLRRELISLIFSALILWRQSQRRRFYRQTSLIPFAGAR